MDLAHEIQMIMELIEASPSQKAADKAIERLESFAAEEYGSFIGYLLERKGVAVVEALAENREREKCHPADLEKDI